MHMAQLRSGMLMLLVVFVPGGSTFAQGVSIALGSTSALAR